MKSSSADPPEYLSVGISSRSGPQWLIRGARRLVNRLAGFTRFNAAYAPVIADGIPDDLAERFLRHIGVAVEINPGGLERIPTAGPVIIVANHPFGMIEGFILNALLRRVRCDYKFLTAYKLAKVPGMAQVQFSVDPIKKGGKRRINLGAWHAVFRWLAEGKAFAVFPAGRVSRFSLREQCVTDVPWSRHIATLVRRTKAPVLPVYFPGANGIFFQLVGLLYGELQNFLVVWEFNRMRRRNYPLVIGSLIQPAEFAAMDSDQRLIDYLRERTYALASETDSARDQLFGVGKSTIS